MHSYGFNTSPLNKNSKESYRALSLRTVIHTAGSKLWEGKTELSKRQRDLSDKGHKFISKMHKSSENAFDVT